MEGEGVVKKKIEQIFVDDAFLELKELIPPRADESTLQEVYNTILKDNQQMKLDNSSHTVMPPI